MSGSTGTSRGNELVAFEGGGKKPLYCYSDLYGEVHVYPKNELKHQYVVHDNFTKTFTFLAHNAGPKGFCAYVFNSNVRIGFLNQYARATAYWTVS